jgi:hypothetical protein
VQCRNIVRPQRIALLHEYARQFDEEVALYQQMMSGPSHRSGREIETRIAEQANALISKTLAQAIRTGAPAACDLSPEQATANLGL